MPGKHHMIEYIHEGPDALRRTLGANETAIEALFSRVRRDPLERVIVAGTGSSYTAALMAAPAFQVHCALPTLVADAADLAYYASAWMRRGTLLILVSRSGERGVVLSALRDAQRRGAFGVAVTGVPDSLLAREAQVALVTREGPEIAFPKTKSVVACTGLLMDLALALARPSDSEAVQRRAALRFLPGALREVIATSEPVLRGVMPLLAAHEPVAVVGSGSNYGAAIEGAMKIQEAACVATRYDSLDGLLNGPVGGLDKRWLLVALVTALDADVVRSLLGVARPLGARTLCLCEEELGCEGLADHILALPARADPLLAALLHLPPLQLLAYEWAVARGLDPDTPTSMRAILDAVLPPDREEPELR